MAGITSLAALHHHVAIRIVESFTPVSFVFTIDGDLAGPVYVETDEHLPSMPWLRTQQGLLGNRWAASKTKVCPEMVVVLLSEECYSLLLASTTRTSANC